jgi:hypothetical protein
MEEEGLFEKLFREKRESLGDFGKTKNNARLKQKRISRPEQKRTSNPMITRPQTQALGYEQPQIIINVGSGGQRGYSPRPKKRRRKRTKKKKVDKRKYIITKQEAEAGLKAAKKGAKKAGKAAKGFVGLFKKKQKTMQDRSLKEKIKGSIYK